MTYEKDVLVSLLKLTKAEGVHKEFLRKDARVSAQLLDEVLGKLSADEFIRQQHDLIEASSSQRIRMAVQAIKLGADFERVSKVLEWTEFESIAGEVFQANGFQVLRNFRFKHAEKRWEVDVLGCKEPFIVCVDCKQWRRGWSRSAIVKAVEVHANRVQALADALPNYYQKARLLGWRNAMLVPMILSLVSSSFKFYNNVPVVPILQLQDFITQLQFEATSLTHFKKKISFIQCNLKDFSKLRNEKDVSEV